MTLQIDCSVLFVRQLEGVALDRLFSPFFYIAEHKHLAMCVSTSFILCPSQWKGEGERKEEEEEKRICVVVFFFALDVE